MDDADSICAAGQTAPPRTLSHEAQSWPMGSSRGLPTRPTLAPCCVPVTPPAHASPSQTRALCHALTIGDSREVAKRCFIHWNTVVLLGHGTQGVPTDHVDAADTCVEIPMIGTGASLNLAVAGSLVLYRLVSLC